MRLSYVLAAATFIHAICVGASGQTIVCVDQDATGPIHDGSSWCTAFLDLQDALEPAIAGTTFQLVNGVTVKGGYAGCGAAGPDQRDIALYETILSGDLNGDDGPDFADSVENSYHVVTGSWTDASPILDGFTMTAGRAEGSFPQSFGGGMFNRRGNPTLIDCTFSGNQASNGGGMCNFGLSNPVVINCTFIGNSSQDLGGRNPPGGGGMYNGDGSSPTLQNCTFSRNTAVSTGGAMCNSSVSSPTLRGCTFPRLCLKTVF